MNTSLAPLRTRNFRLLFSAQAASVVGDQIAPIAVTFAVLDVTGSPTSVGVVLAARTAALVAFVLVGGVWADRLPRHRLMMASDVGRCGTQALLAVLLVTDTASVWQIAVLQAANGAAAAFFEPAAVGLMPTTVRQADLQRANALMSFTRSVAQVVGPALAGILVATLGAGWAVAADASTFAISAAFLGRMRLPVHVRPVEARSFVSELTGGWQAVRSRQWLAMMIALLAVFQILVLATFYVLGPVIAEGKLGGAGAWAVVVGAWGVGAVIGAVVGLRRRFERPLIASNLIVLLVVPPMILTAVAAPTGIIAFSAVGAGVGMSLAGVLYDTAVQEHVPPEVLGRVAAFEWMGSTALRPVGYVVVGPVAGLWGAGPTLAGAGVLTACLMVGSLAAAPIRSVRSRSGVV